MGIDRILRGDEIFTLERQGCVAEDWAEVTVGDGFNPYRVRNVQFSGKVRIGALRTKIPVEGGVELPAEIHDATIADCYIGDNVRIHHVGGHIAHYKIEDGAVIEHIGTMATHPGASFGTGVEIVPINEAGGRQIRLFSELSSQFAYMMCLHRGRPILIEKLILMINREIMRSRADMGSVGRNARIVGVSEIVDVSIGAYAEVIGAGSLRNGTILSEKQSPTYVGAAVVARDFIIGEGSNVDSGASLDRVFVGQSVQVGRNFSAQDSLFFANCEAFHGEACAIFAGPFTVTHHKNTLLIAAYYNFFNAGSGTNASNHMYKLGPVHEGRFMRGSKTGSFAYLLLPSVVAPYSVVIGRLGAGFDAGEFPFSYIVGEEGRTWIMPAINLFKVGTIRDAEKWPRRDRRTASVLRDQILFETFNPYTAELMMRGERTLGELYDKTTPVEESVRYRGLMIKHAMLHAGPKIYAGAIDAYLARRIVERARAGKSPAEDPDSLYSPQWADVAGLLISRARLEEIEKAIEAGEISSVAQFQAKMAGAAAAYGRDEWAWVRRTYEQRRGKPVDELSEGEIEQLAKESAAWSMAAYKKLISDASKEFGEAARYGYGMDQDSPDEDFNAVRGGIDSDPNVRSIQGRMRRAEEGSGEG